MKTKELLFDTYYIYCVLDEKESMIYIGFINDPKRRFAEHKRFSSNPKIRKMLNEWGEIKFRIIAEFSDCDLAREYEEFLIQKYGNSIYNISGNDRI